MILVVAGVVSCENYIGGVITKCVSVDDWYMQETAILAMMIIQVTVLLLDKFAVFAEFTYHKSNQPIKLLLFLF